VQGGCGFFIPPGITHKPHDLGEQRGRRKRNRSIIKTECTWGDENNKQKTTTSIVQTHETVISPFGWKIVAARC